MALKSYPIGIQTFEKIRKEDRLYIDKTEYIYNITHSDACYYFLSRPRRFGKSLLISTFESYFSGKKDLFKGLAIEQLEHEWAEYPVLHFSMAGGKHMEKEQLEDYLLYALQENESRFGIKSSDYKAPNLRLLNLIRTVYQNTGKQVVVLIDEYDAPLLDVVHEDKYLEELRYIMRNFYSPLKDCDPMLRFVFLTGITKYPQGNLFGGLNNITDVSLDERYTAICGITENEIFTQMSEDLDTLAEAQEMTREQIVIKLKEYYGGYQFSKHTLNVFNPFSLFNCFANGKFGEYWFCSSVSITMLRNLKKFDALPLDIESMEAEATDFYVSMESMQTFVPLLYQSGYITIKNYDKEYKYYTLDVPNREVKEGIEKFVNQVYQ